MTINHRRRLLKVVSGTLPAAWFAPVVQSIVLPAHAQSSPIDCSASADCYHVVGQGVSFLWPGGTGPETVPLFSGDACEGDPVVMALVVVAANADDAEEALQCGGEIFEATPGTDPAATPGCNFFSCTLLD